MRKEEFVIDGALIEHFLPNMTRPRHALHGSTLLFLLLSTFGNTFAAVKLPSIFGDHMVLQRDQEIHVWGWDTPKQTVTVTLGGNQETATTAESGRWSVKLPPLTGGRDRHQMKVSGSSTVTFKDVLIGEVWLCSGQSNMQWSVSQSNDPDLELLTAKFPQIRLITVPQVGTQDPQKDFVGAWQPCTPESAATFSAVGYYFGR
ncbi:MAG: sialate O-acetylesterase, partial [Verrucomicrobiota bacterium]